MEKIYKTKQKASILDFLINNKNKHVTADEIIRYFEDIGNPISKSTIYRNLDALVEENTIRKYITQERGNSACYQFIDNKNECIVHYHLKCIECEKLIHLTCDEITELTEHIYKEHKFKLDSFKTVLYGTCEDCLNKREKK